MSVFGIKSALNLMIINQLQIEILIKRYRFHSPSIPALNSVLLGKNKAKVSFGLIITSLN